MSLYDDLINDSMRQLDQRLQARVERELATLPPGHRLCQHGPQPAATELPTDFRDDLTTFRFQVRVHALGPDERCDRRDAITYYPTTPDQPALSVRHLGGQPPVSTPEVADLQRNILGRLESEYNRIFDETAGFIEPRTFLAPEVHVDVPDQAVVREAIRRRLDEYMANLVAMPEPSDIRDPR
jgi:hypothetical protein